MVLLYLVFAAGVCAGIGAFLGGVYDESFSKGVDHPAGVLMGTFGFPSVCVGAFMMGGYIKATDRQQNLAFWLTVAISAVGYYFLIPFIGNQNTASDYAWFWQLMIAFLPFIVYPLVLAPLAANATNNVEVAVKNRGAEGGDYEVEIE